MLSEITVGRYFVVVVVTVVVLPSASRAQQSCDLEGTRLTHLAQAMLNRANDTTKAESRRSAAYREAWEAVAGLVRDSTEGPTPYILGAQAQVGLGNYSRADGLLDAFTSRAPKECKQLAREIRYQSWANIYNRAIEAYNSGNTSRALRLFEQANSIYDDARSLVNAAALYQERGNLDRAKELYEKAVKVGGEQEQVRLAKHQLRALRDTASTGTSGGASELPKGRNWSGTGDKTTETFKMPESGWRIEWTLSGGEMSSITVFVRRAGSGDVVTSASANSPGSNSSYVHESGRFYLEIVSANAEWTVRAVRP